MDFKNYSLLELSDMIRDGKATSEEIYAYFLDRTKKYNGELNVFTTLPEENASTSPGQALSQPGIGNHLPIAVKDIFCEV